MQLLQQLDEYLVGYRASRYVADLAGVLQAMPEGRGFAMWLMFIDGQVPVSGSARSAPKPSRWR